MNTALHYHLAGLGAACGSGAATVHAAVGGGLQTAAAALAMAPDPTMVTKIAAGVLEVAALVQNFFFHPDCSKIATTQIVNKAQEFVTQNLQAWQTLTPAEKTPANQQAALQTFDAVWAQVVQACGSGQYGTAGQNCIGDRQEGACHYQPNGKCWNWFIGYRDPIANDPQVAANAASGFMGMASSGGFDTMLLLAGAAVVLIVVANL
jgi:hypothetical protein